MVVTQFPQPDHDARVVGSGSNWAGGVPEQASRKASFHHVATIILSSIGFAGLAIGLSHLLNGNGWLAYCLRSASKDWQSPPFTRTSRRNAGSSFNPFRGGRSLALYGLLIILIVCGYSYNRWYRLLRANEVAGEPVHRSEADYSDQTFAGLRLDTRRSAKGSPALLPRRRHEPGKRRRRTATRVASHRPKGLAGFGSSFAPVTASSSGTYTATQIATKVRRTRLRGEVVRARALGQHGEIRVTEAAINEQLNRSTPRP